jgi:predicted dehydrogenase
LANLRALGWSDIRLFRTGHSTQPDAELADLPADFDLDTALSRRPIAVIVANPTALHIPVAMAAARAGAHLLIEKPLSDDLRGVPDLERLVAERGLVALVGFQFRFNPGLRQVHAWLRAGAIGDVVTAQAHWGEYLPGMHPWEDYRGGYAARPDLGGGVLLTLCHPFDYLRWLIGDFEPVSAVESRRDTLGLTVDTCVDVTGRFAGGASAHIHLDFVERPPNHRLTVIGTEGTITWNAGDSTACRTSATSARSEIVPAPEGFERNWMFRDEMQHFLACVRGEAAPLCTMADGRAAMEAILAARQALDRSSFAAPAS